MRMRKKPNLLPRMEKCEAIQIKNPIQYKGHWCELFPDYKEIRLELGCGKGKFTCEMARRMPEGLLLALEKVEDAMVIAMERALQQNIPNVRFLDIDAVLLPEMFERGEISRIYINFPDPWRKTRQFKRRLTAPSFLKMYYDALPEEGEIWFKSDNKPLFDWSIESFKACGWELRPMPEGTPMTDYETKFTEQGLPIYRVIAVRPETFIMPEKIEWHPEGQEEEA